MTQEELIFSAIVFVLWYLISFWLPIGRFGQYLIWYVMGIANIYLMMRLL